MMKYYVSHIKEGVHNGTQNYTWSTSIQGALDLAEAGDTIVIGPGKYHEKVEITTPDIRLMGTRSSDCIIAYNDHALKLHEDGKKYGTFRSYTMLVMANDVQIENLTIMNEAGDGREVGQAIALYVEGDRFECHNCSLEGHQDTLFAGPLPEAPVIAGSFVGPSEARAYEQSKQFYKKCTIIGDVDYIFGSAMAVFRDCRMVTRNRQEQVNGYITAPSTWPQEAYGFVFINCDFLGQEGIEAETVYFGRPWRPYAQVTIIDCSYDDSIHEDHWDYWGKVSNKASTRFREYACWRRKDGHSTYDSVAKQEPFITRTQGSANLDFLDKWHIERLTNH